MTDKNGSHTYQPRPNSNPIFLKRLICTGFDVVSLFLVFMALTYVITRTPLAAEYNRHVESYKEIERTVLEQVGNDSRRYCGSDPVSDNTSAGSGKGNHRKKADRHSAV